MFNKVRVRVRPRMLQKLIKKRIDYAPKQASISVVAPNTPIPSDDEGKASYRKGAYGQGTITENRYLASILYCCCYPFAKNNCTNVCDCVNILFEE